MHMLPLAAVILSCAALPLFLALLYHVLGRPLIALHFCDDLDSRRRCPQKLRRRTFEHHCSRALICLFGVGMLGGLRNVLQELAPGGGTTIVGFQVLLLVGGGLFTWAAISRWTNPFED